MANIQANNNERTLSPLAFWLALCGALVIVGFTIYNIIVVILVLAGVGGVSIGIMSLITQFTEAGGMVKDILFWVFIGLGAIVALAFAIVLGIYASYLLKVLKHRTKPRNTNYMRTMMIISIIYLILNFSSLFSGDWVALVGLLANAAVVAAFFIQLYDIGSPKAKIETTEQK